MSGKRARSIRKSNKISKKTLAGAVLGVCLCASPAVAEQNFLLSIYPHYTMPLIGLSSMENGIGAGLKLTYRPIPYVDIYVDGDYQHFGFSTTDVLGDMSIINGGLGLGYHLPMTDRFSMNINAGVGAYNAMFNIADSNDKKIKPYQGINVGATINFSYRIGPAVSTDVNASGIHYMASSSGLLTGTQLSPGITVNLTKAFKNSTNIAIETLNVDPVFPVLYSWYENNSFGKVSITNEEDVKITDVKVSFYQPQYMGHPNECGSISSLGKGESFDVDLTAFFNEQMLELIEMTSTQANVIVEYKYLGQKKTATYTMAVPVYGRNNMSWADDRCASVFVSSKDPAALWFAKYITSIVRDNVRSGVALNIQYAMGIFEALDQFGLNYVIDPTSAFADNIGTAAIDFLQFPYQTLMYRGGDCDDLSILVSSLFEAVGIETAFITIPGHIFMAFNSGLTVEQAELQFTNFNECIIDGDEVWIPLEITLTDEGFNKAWRVGAREWNQAAANGDAALYKMKDSWKVYRPVSVPGATARFTLPDEKVVGKLFSHSVDEYILKQIQPRIDFFERKLTVNKSSENYNDFGVLYARYGLFAKAEGQLKNARRQEYLPSVLNTANLYYSMKDFVRAQKWYEQVLAKDPENIYAMLGIARCAYETGEYDICDEYYEIVYKRDLKLAKEFAYLGSFEDTKGRSFTLADRLSNTYWMESKDQKKKIEEQIAVQTFVEPVIREEEVVKEEITSEPVNPSENSLIPDFILEGIALVPDSEIREEIEEDENGDEEDEITFDDPIKTERKYKGILSQLEFEMIPVDELIAAASDVVDVSDISVEEIQASTNVDKEIAFVEMEEIVPQIPETTSPTSEIESSESIEEIEAEKVEINQPVIEDAIVSAPAPVVAVSRPVPRFTKQPSEDWAPSEAYNVDIIPGMRSFEEEMGEYSNDKAYLYQEEFAFAVNPEEDTNDDSEELNVTNSQFIAMSGVPDVNPFASFLSEEDTKKVEEITNYSITEIKKEIEQQYEPIPEPVSVPVPVVVAKVENTEKIEIAEETLIEDTVVENTIVEEKSEEKLVEPKQNISTVVVETKSTDEKIDEKLEIKSEVSSDETIVNNKTEMPETKDIVVVQKEAESQAEEVKHIESKIQESKIQEDTVIRGKGLLALIISGGILATGGAAAGIGISVNKKGKKKIKKEGEE